MSEKTIEILHNIAYRITDGFNHVSNIKLLNIDGYVYDDNFVNHLNTMRKKRYTIWILFNTWNDRLNMFSMSFEIL